MATEYAQILAAGTAPAPLDYTVPNAQELVPLAINAVIDGTGAGVAFLAVVEVVSDGGVVIARCPTTATIAAGGSAEVSWFPLRRGTSTSAGTSPYESLILATPGIRAYWKLDETSGTTAVDSGNAGANLPYIGSPSLAQPPLADGFAVFFTAASSQRVGSYLPADSLAINGNGQMTVEFWVKTTAAVATGLVWADSNSSNGRFFRVEMSAAGVPTYAIFDDGATGHSLVGVAAINDGATHYCVGTFDGTTMKWYVDGTLDNSTVPAMGGFPLEHSNHGVVLGAKFATINYSEYLTGTLDEVAIYDLALTQAQITQHFAAG